MFEHQDLQISQIKMNKQIIVSNFHPLEDVSEKLNYLI